MKTKFYCLFALMLMFITANPMSVYATEEQAATPPIINQTQPDAVTKYGCTVYDFRQSRTIGTTAEGVPLDFETFEGMTLAVVNNSVTYRYYTHAINPATGTKDIAVKTRLIDNNYAFIKDLNTAVEETVYTVDTTSLKNGVYAIETTSSLGLITEGWFLVENKIPVLVRTDMNDMPDTINNSIQMADIVTAGLNPLACLDISSITYPGLLSYPDGTKAPIETQVYMALSNQILASHTAYNIQLDATPLTDSEKVYIFTEWLRQTFAYDSFITDQFLSDNARAGYMSRLSNNLNAYLDENNYMLYNHVGVCWDYACALAIMCRAQQIPCITIDSPGHTYNLVYLDNQWLQIDVSHYNKYFCNQFDTNSLLWQYDQNERVRLHEYAQPIWTCIPGTMDKSLHL